MVKLHATPKHAFSLPSNMEDILKMGLTHLPTVGLQFLALDQYCIFMGKTMAGPV